MVKKQKRSKAREEDVSDEAERNIKAQKYKSFRDWWEKNCIKGGILRKKKTYKKSQHWVKGSTAWAFFSSAETKNIGEFTFIQIISINRNVSRFLWIQIMPSVPGEHKSHREGYMMCYWMEIRGSLFCQLLLAISSTICWLKKKAFNSFSLPETA